MWYLERQGVWERSWATLIVGGSTGLPVLKLNFRLIVEGLKVCPFLVPVSANGERSHVLCAIHEVRPVVCRIWPLGRFMEIEPGGQGEWQYRIASRCPGFESLAEGEQLPAGNAPARVVGEWVAQQTVPEQDDEKQFYLETVIPAFMEAGLHASTERNSSGRLSDEEALELGARVLYDPLSAPPDPAGDHKAIMAWMQGLVEAIASEAMLLRGALRATAGRARVRSKKRRKKRR